MSEQCANFRRLIAGLDVRAALEELSPREDLWKELTVRQAYEGSSHVDTETIVLRGPETTEGLFDNLDAVDFKNIAELPETAAFVQGTSRFLQAREVGRILLVRLQQGGWIRPHVDEGAYARYFARFHLVLESNRDCIFRAGEDRVHMAAGELWWFNHQVTHSVLNTGPARIHLIMDFAAPGFTGALGTPR